MCIAAIACTPIAKSDLNPLRRERFAVLIAPLVLIAFIVCTAFIVDASYNPFLYFRF
jgi:alginate O-acetyltransferase complex protein AlgI